MTCKYCNGTGIWISPIYGVQHKCLECPKEIKKETSQVVYDEGSGIKDSGGWRRWYVKNEYHREAGEGPAAISPRGNQYWYKHGKMHREDGPAVEWQNGGTEWYINDRRHRENGPAYENTNGDCYWYINGKEFSKSAFDLLSLSEKQVKIP